MPRTLCPAEISSFTVGVPIKPVAPVTKIRILKLLFWFTDRVKVGKYFRRNPQRRSLEILPKMLAGRCSWDQQNVGRALQKPRQSNLHRRRTEARGDIRQLCRLQWREPAEWKERHVRNPVVSEILDEHVIGSMHEVVVILYTDNRDHPPRFRNLGGRDVAQPDMAYQAFLLKLGQDGKRRLHRTLGWFVNAEHAAQVDNIYDIQTQIAKIVMNLRS